jgi:Kip1 ubiquitination-promoting complex protein 1
MPTVEHRQMKICSTCFDVTVSLLRTIEMVICVAPNVMLDKHLPKCEMLLVRLLQVKLSPFHIKKNQPIRFALVT